MIGSMALRESGGAILALQTGVHTFDFETGAATLIADPEADDPSTRFNDGKVDRQGRFLTGTMATRIGEEARGSIYRLDTDFSLHRLKGGVIVANGPCFSPDGATFYFADTRRNAIFAYDYDTATGAIGRSAWPWTPRLMTAARMAAQWTAKAISGPRSSMQAGSPGSPPTAASTG